VKRLQLFHFSPKYKGMGERLINEALAAFSGERAVRSVGKAAAAGAKSSRTGEAMGDLDGAAVRDGRSETPPV